MAILDKELEKGGTGLTREELEEIAGNYGELQEDGNTIKTEEGYEIKIDEIYQPGGGTGGGSGASDEEIAALEEKIKELEQTIEDLKSKQATGDATVEQVLEEATFSNSSETGLTGTMPNRGTLDWNPNNSTSYTVEPGYYSGGTLDSSGAYNAGVTATKAEYNSILTFPIQANSRRITLVKSANWTGNGTSCSSSYTCSSAGYYIAILAGNIKHSSGATDLGLSISTTGTLLGSSSNSSSYIIKLIYCKSGNKITTGGQMWDYYDYNGCVYRVFKIS